MGLWGAAQAVGFALGGLFGAAASDLARQLLGAPAAAYASVFLLEALMFLAAAALAKRIAAVKPTKPVLEESGLGRVRAGQLARLARGR